MEKSSYTMYITRSFNFTFRYIDYVLSPINAKIDDLVAPIYPTELEMEETTVAARSVSYLELHLESYSGSRLRTKLYDKRDDFHNPIVNFPSIRSNIPAATAYGVYISLLKRYSRPCGSYQ